MSEVIRLRESAVYSQLAHESAVVALTAAGPTGESALRPLLEESLDWETVITLANRERAVGPVARDLGRLGTGAVPRSGGVWSGHPSYLVIVRVTDAV